MKKKKYLKIEIIKKFIGSAAFAAVGVVLFFYLGFSAFYFISPIKYAEYMNWFNTSYLGMAGLMCIGVVCFCVLTFAVFMKKMNTITDIVADISNNIKEIADGNLDVQIEVSSEDELGSLAFDINRMAKKWKKSREKEMQWNNERYQMITNLSHDLKTPMMSINGYVDRIYHKKYENEEELKQYCEIVERKTGELNASITQLFELSKISSTEFKPTICQIHLKQFTEQVLMEFIPELEKGNMGYGIYMDPALTVNADPKLLKKICENLISNTLKYAKTREGLKIFAEQKTDGIYVLFENYGEMIPEEEKTAIFEKFYQEKKNINGEGSGCGLAIVKQMMQLQNGKVWVESSEKKTDFVLQFLVS